MNMQTSWNRHARYAAVCALAILCGIAPRWASAAGQDLFVRRADGVTVLFQVEIADTAPARTRGLMQRATLDPRNGMLFDFKRETAIRMWMKNTLIPLDMFFIDANGRIRHIATDTVPHSETLIAAPVPARYVLELNAGEAARFGIEVGDRLLLSPR